MENVRIASTPLAGLRPAPGPGGQVVTRDHGRLVAALAQLAHSAPDAALLFAEPVPARDRSRVDWYGAGGKIYTPLTQLPAERRGEVLARVDELLALVRGEAERLGDNGGAALMAATTVPEPREAYIHVARDGGEADRWHPVLVAWSQTNDAPARAGAAPQIMVRQATLPAAASQSAAVLASAPAQIAANPRSIRAWLLWLALALLLIFMAWLLLRACGMGLPGYGVFHRVGQTFCPGVALAATAGEDEKGRGLAELARQLELQIVQKQVACMTEMRRAEAAPPPASPNAPPSTLPSTPPTDIERRLEKAKAKSGEFQISLAWDGNADLDLRVFCPSGEEISYSRRNGCGGVLDVDMNGPNDKSTTPVENVFWEDGKVPIGKIRVAVILYDRKGDWRPTIPFVVRIKNGSDVKMIPGAIGQERKLVEVAEIEVK